MKIYSNSAAACHLCYTDTAQSCVILKFTIVTLTRILKVTRTEFCSTFLAAETTHLPVCILVGIFTTYMYTLKIVTLLIMRADEYPNFKRSNFNKEHLTKVRFYF